ncbi:bifunctional indole-3-glycerol phosphate synthase/phosphoribosylanthranilate isomerase [Gracilinema caldarium]|uniref:N-(5'-phosphoribosyl)anthranilate isomerase n=1 Tax=Gracilinema caldarium (strain ATCC 51460 / DSM 7334 / H1) TaxID=744872 RepID=F8EWV8_GRAC1|nr:bifunctional indole-3-glycerol phosphate synthase/phosphoribosylanthranilate isomerase [Gracilinema caldarium]AEJ18344.1 Indole-3-glycerol-phosphate synthase., Phosphoribosylanthranilate isomerase [Gracilinema caldarium DSM 7334]
MPDILDTIIEQRKRDLSELGPTFGLELPRARERPVVPFLQKRGAILEIKRASPSKGDIAPNLDVPTLCRQYQEAGASAVSVLTEPHFFKGSLLDLLTASRSDGVSGGGGPGPQEALQSPTHHTKPLAFLRKDFLLTEEEVEVSYRCGADAVLLIARILDADRLLAMAARSHDLGLCALVEVRTEEDVEKLVTVSRHYPVLAGVNARDLATFTIDPLIPAAMIRRLPVRAVYESGIHSPAMARYAAKLGYQGILVGEGAAKNPEQAAKLVSAFMQAGQDSRTAGGSAGGGLAEMTESPTKGPTSIGRFWRALAERREAKGASGVPQYFLSSGSQFEAGPQFKANTQFRPSAQFGASSQFPASPGLGAGLPLVKICGLTRTEDALKAAALGADLLGFVFAESKRTVQTPVVREIRQALQGILAGDVLHARLAESVPPVGTNGSKFRGSQPLLVGVINRLDSPLAEAAITLCREGILDAIQWHGDPLMEDPLLDELPHYRVVPVGSPDDIDLVRRLLARGVVRILLDAKLEGQSGGTGTMIGEELLDELCKEIPELGRSSLWLAGGLGPDTIGPVVARYGPELIDASSRLEAEPGKKDWNKLELFLREIEVAGMQWGTSKNRSFKRLPNEKSSHIHLPQVPQQEIGVD